MICNMATDKTTDNKEPRVLQAVKSTLTAVIKDTATEPGIRHPLSPETIIKLRDCLALISARERELSEESLIDMSQRPVFKDQKKNQPADSIVVPLNQIGRPKPKSQ